MGGPFGNTEHLMNDRARAEQRTAEIKAGAKKPLDTEGLPDELDGLEGDEFTTTLVENWNTYSVNARKAAMRLSITLKLYGDVDARIAKAQGLADADMTKPIST